MDRLSYRLVEGHGLWLMNEAKEMPRIPHQSVRLPLWPISHKSSAIKHFCFGTDSQFPSSRFMVLIRTRSTLGATSEDPGLVS